MSRKRKPKHAPGDIYFSKEMGCRVQINQHGDEEPWQPAPLDPFPDPPEPDPVDDIPRRADGSISPFYELSQDELERLRQPNMKHDTARARRTRHDGWTLERQKNFIETLAATASVVNACRYVGMSRQSADKLYNRSPQFRAAWHEATKASVHVLVDTAFDRAVNGTQEQVWHDGRMVGFKEKHHDRLLMYLLRVRDPLNFAPLSDLAGWQRHRGIEQQPDGIGPTLDRLEEAERTWQQAEEEPRQLIAPADHLDPPAPPAAPRALEAPAPDPSAPLTSSEPREPEPESEPLPRSSSTPTTSSTSSQPEPLPRSPSTTTTSSTSPPPGAPLQAPGHPRRPGSRPDTG
jgi:hypothetical protein